MTIPRPFEFCLRYPINGVTDQLWGYRLASAMLEPIGGRYRHRGFDPSFSGAAVLALLGLDAAFAAQRIRPEEEDRLRPLVLPSEGGDRAGLPAQLRAAVEAVLAATPDAILDLEIDQAMSVTRRLRFALANRLPWPPDPRIANLAAGWIAAEPDLPLDPARLNVVVHLRLGDTWEFAVPPQETLIPRRPAHFPSCAGRNTLSLAEVYAILSLIRAGNRGQHLNLLLFSDGLDRALRDLDRTEPPLTPFQAAMARPLLVFDRAGLHLIERSGFGPGWFGEDPRHLRKLLAAILRADLVLIFGRPMLAEKLTHCLLPPGSAPTILRFLRQRQGAGPPAAGVLAPGRRHDIALADNDLRPVFALIDRLAARKRGALSQPSPAGPTNA